MSEEGLSLLVACEKGRDEQEHVQHPTRGLGELRQQLNQEVRARFTRDFPGTPYLSAIGYARPRFLTSVLAAWTPFPHAALRDAGDRGGYTHLTSSALSMTMSTQVTAMSGKIPFERSERSLPLWRTCGDNFEPYAEENFPEAPTRGEDSKDRIPERAP